MLEKIRTSAGEYKYTYWKRYVQVLERIRILGAADMLKNHCFHVNENLMY